MSKIPAELDAEMTPAVRAFVESLLARIEQLEARLGMTPENSSLPPSSRHPHAKPGRKARGKTKRKRGGQPGHKKHERALVPLQDVDELVVRKPKHCRRCGERLNGSDPEPIRHQVWELPEIKPNITEYQMQPFVFRFEPNPRVDPRHPFTNKQTDPRPRIPCC